jgi:hypothetical protein
MYANLEMNSKYQFLPNFSWLYEKDNLQMEHFFIGVPIYSTNAIYYGEV